MKTHEDMTGDLRGGKDRKAETPSVFFAPYVDDSEPKNELHSSPSTTARMEAMKLEAINENDEKIKSSERGSVSFNDVQLEELQEGGAREVPVTAAAPADGARLKS